MRNNHHQLITEKSDRVDAALPAVLGGGALIATATTNVADVIRIATHQIQDVLAEINSTVEKCEAEVEVNEKINVIFEAQRTVFSVERSFRFAKDRA
jgi:hypothetical protein